MYNKQESGVLLIAHGRPAYLKEAAALAISIKMFSPHTPVALASGFDSLSPFEGVFDHVIPVEKELRKGVTTKLWLDKLTPYRGTTLFLDTDTIVFGELDSYVSRDDWGFTAFGRMYPTVHHWFSSPEVHARKFGDQLVPCFVGGCYLFTSGTESARVFSTARSLLPKYRELGIEPLDNRTGSCNEEPLLALSMMEHGIVCRDEVDGPTFNMTRAVYRDLSSHALVNSQRYTIGDIPRPALHFQAYRRQWRYRCLQFQLLNWFTSGNKEVYPMNLKATDIFSLGVQMYVEKMSRFFVNLTGLNR
ncbi:MAG: hypothetical protein J0M26_06705 [Planctomycetes bacterium]|nr:hypothetical protein [Planctomycetota bacterium]